MCCDDPSPPDYGPLADASEESARIMAELGHEQIDFARQRYEESKPIYERIVNSQLGIQDRLDEQAQDYYDYQTETFRPLERGLVADAEMFNTEAYRDELAARAAADAGLAFNTTRAANERAMRSMGVNPSSGRYQAISGRAGLGLAAARANALTTTRSQAREMGWAKRMDAAGLGRNLPGASTGAYSAAVNAGNSAGNNQGAPGAAAVTGMNAGANTVGSGLSMQLSGLSSVLNNQTKWAIENNESFLGNLGGGLGVAAGIYKGWPSNNKKGLY